MLVVHGIDGLVPISKHFLNADAAKAFAKHCKANEEELSLEFRQMNLMLQWMNEAPK